MLAIMERLRLPKLPAHAVLLKPQGQGVVNERKLFKDEAEFCEIESSLASSTLSEQSITSPKLVIERNKVDILPRSTSVPNLKIGSPRNQSSTLFYLS